MKPVQRIETHSLRRFMHKVKLIKWEETNLRVYLRVSYGKHKDYKNTLVTFYNDGFYAKKSDFDLALKAFLEK